MSTSLMSSRYIAHIPTACRVVWPKLVRPVTCTPPLSWAKKVGIVLES